MSTSSNEALLRAIRCCITEGESEYQGGIGFTRQEGDPGTIRIIMEGPRQNRTEFSLSYALVAQIRTSREDPPEEVQALLTEVQGVLDSWIGSPAAVGSPQEAS